MNDPEAVFFKTAPLLLWDAESLQIIDANKKALEIFGQTRGDLPSKKMTDLGEPLAIDGKSSVDEKPAETSQIPQTQVLWTLSDLHEKHRIVQLTTHRMENQGKVAELVVIHDIPNFFFLIKKCPSLAPRYKTQAKKND